MSELIYKIKAETIIVFSGNDEEGEEYVEYSDYASQAELPVINDDGTIRYIKLPKFEGPAEFASKEEAVKEAAKWVNTVLYREAHMALPDPESDWEYDPVFRDYKYDVPEDHYDYDGKEVMVVSECYPFTMRSKEKDTHLGIYIFEIRR